jgi:hypothetical protein
MGTRYKPSSAGARALLNSPAMMDGIGRMVAQGCADANAMNRHGSGYEADVRPGMNRCHGMIKTTDFGSILDNARHNTLLKALGGVRA